MESIVSNKIAKDIMKAKLIVIIPLCILGLYWSLYRVYSYTDNLSFVLQKILPFTTLLLLLILVMIFRFGTKERINNKYTINETKLIFNNGYKKKVVFLKDIISIKENKFGLTITGKQKTIYLPQQIEKYDLFKSRLYGLDVIEKQV